MVSRVFWENYARQILNEKGRIINNNQIIDIIKLYAEKLPKLLE